MTENLTQRVEIVGQDLASAAIRDVIETLSKLDRQARKTSETLGRAFGADLKKRFESLQTQTKTFGSDLTEAAMQAAKALKSDVAAADELRKALQGVVAEQKRMAEAAKASQTAFSQASATEARSIRTAATARGRASTASLRDVRYLAGVRERSERAELDHVKAVRRERAGLRREVARSARETVSRGHHAIKRINHPVYESAGLYAAAAGVGAIEAGKRIVEATADLDTAMTRLKMFAPSIDSGQARKSALLDSISLGMDASKVIDVQAKAIRDGVAPEIARSLPKGIAAAAQVMGGDVEKLTDSLAEGIQESAKMGWIKNGADARRYLNLEAGLSNFGGNTAEKTEQFVAAGGLGHGKELGLDMTSSMAYGALLNSSGMRTGQASARFLGQLSQNVPKMFDRYRSAVDSHKNSEEDRAVRSAPGRLGYGSVREMQSRILAGPEGLIDFATRLQKLDDKARKLVLEGYGFSEQGGAALAEIGAGPDKAKAVLSRAKDLAAQKEANDYLAEKFAQWQTSLANMLQQIEAGWRAIESEVGDVLKTDIIAPLRDWWVMLSAAIVNSDLKDKIHGAIIGFVNGLGFDDVKALLDSMTANARGFDFAAFAKGVGEGIRNVADGFSHLGGAFGNMDPETIGKLSAELFGLSLAAHAIGPVVGIVGSVASGLLALKAAVDLGAGLLRLTGIADGLKAIAGVELATTATSMLAVAGGLTTIGAAIQGLLDLGVLNRMHMPKDTSASEIDKFLWGSKPDGSSARPAWVDRLSGGDASRAGTPESDAYWKRKRAALHLESYDGGDFRSLFTKTSYSPSDSGEVVRDAMVDSSRTIIEVRDELIKTNDLLKQSITGDVGGDGPHGGDAGASGARNMRYGPGGRSPAGGGGGPRVSGGAGGSRSWRNNNPGNIEYGAYAKSMGAIGTDGRFAVFPDYAAGRHAQEHLLFESKQYKDLTLGQAIGKWAPGSENNVPAYIAAMGGDPNAKMSSFNPAQRSALLDAMQKHEGWKVGTRQNSTVSPDGNSSFQGGSGNTGGAVDKALSMLGMGEGASGKALGAYMHSGEWCADFVNATLKSAGVKGSGSAMAASFSQWGKHVDLTNAQKGDVIEQQRGGRVGHVGFATGNVQRDRYGKVTAMEMVSGNWSNRVSKSWLPAGAIADLRRSGEAITQGVVAATKPAAIAKKVQSITTPQGGDSARTSGPVDNSMVNHFTINHHNSGDPHATAGAITAQLDKWHSKTFDVDPFA